MTDRERWANRAWVDGSSEFYDRGEPDAWTCNECGRELENEAEFDTCEECIDAQEGRDPLERLMMSVIENRTDIGDEALEY